MEFCNRRKTCIQIIGYAMVPPGDELWGRALYNINTREQYRQACARDGEIRITGAEVEGADRWPL